jgi:hypothetical protein
MNVMYNAKLTKFSCFSCSYTEKLDQYVLEHSVSVLFIRFFIEQFRIFKHIFDVTE